MRTVVITNYACERCEREFYFEDFPENPDGARIACETHEAICTPMILRSSEEVEVVFIRSAEEMELRGIEPQDEPETLTFPGWFQRHYPNWPLTKLLDHRRQNLQTISKQYETLVQFRRNLLTEFPDSEG